MAKKVEGPVVDPIFLMSTPPTWLPVISPPVLLQNMPLMFVLNAPDVVVVNSIDPFTILDPITLPSPGVLPPILIPEPLVSIPKKKFNPFEVVVKGTAATERFAMILPFIDRKTV